MIIREMRTQDISEIEKFHEKHFPDIEFPDFMKMYLAFMILDDDERLIMAGGLRPVAEIHLVSNLDQSRLKIGKALVEAQRIASFTATRYKIDELLAFTENSEYASHLIQHGFHPREGALSLKVPNG